MNRDVYMAHARKAIEHDTLVQPRGGLNHDWQYWSLVYQRRLRRLKKLVCAQGYEIRSDESGMPIELIRLHSK